MKKFVTYVTIYAGDKLPPYYIGSTSKDKILRGNYFGSVTSKKWSEIFRCELKNNKHLFSIEILSEHETRQDAIDAELNLQILFNVVKSNNFFNESLASVNGYFGRDVSGTNHPHYGKHWTEYQMVACPDSLRNKSLSDEHKKKISEANKGKKRSDVCKKKISDSHKGIKASNITKVLMSLAKLGDKNNFYGKQHSKETKQLISSTKKVQWQLLSEDDKLKNKINQNNRVNILQYDLQGNFIKEYLSIRDIEKHTGFLRPAISGVLNGKYKQAYGYLWKRSNM